jgi:hypothetical protein
MADLFRSPKRRIASAKQHIQYLEAGIKAFLDSKPYAHVVEPDIDGFEAHKVKLTQTFPDGLINEAVRAAEDLRAALDQAGFASAVASGKSNPKNTYFPIANSATELETSIIGRGRCKDLPPDILALFRSFKPYKGGNDLVWAVNQVANGTKHRLLIPIGMQTNAVRTSHLGSSGYAKRLGGDQWDADKDEMVFAVVSPGSNVQYNMQLAFIVAFGPIETIFRKPAVRVLGRMTAEVERIVLATEAECRRLNLL